MLDPLVIIVGPTAVGKSAVGIELALKLNGEIISGDSIQVYRGLDIGTAKVSLKERKLVPHHLIDFIDPTEPFSVADYQVLAESVIKDITKRGKLPILVGGTGLYIRSVVDQYEFSQANTDLQLRQSLKEEARQVGELEMHRRLATVDHKAAQKIHPHDLKRVIRALEVYSLSGKPISDCTRLIEGQKPKYKAVWIGLDLKREVLYKRIEDRVDQMIEKGLVDEVKKLLESGVKPESNSMQALGYKEIIGYIQGEYDLSTAISLIKRNTRRYAKRQLTWFRREKRINWFDVGKYSDSKEMIHAIYQLICRTINLNVELKNK